MKLAQVRSYALSLPETTEEPHFDFTSFRVRKKIFVTVPPAETHIHIFVADEEREVAQRLYPEFVEKLVWGGKVCGLRVHLAAASPPVVKKLVKDAWTRKAPKRVVANFAPELGKHAP